MGKSENIIVDKSFEFSLMIIKIYQKLKSKGEFDFARQLLRAGTSIGQMLKNQLPPIPGRILIIKWELPQGKQEKPDIG